MMGLEFELEYGIGNMGLVDDCILGIRCLVAIIYAKFYEKM